MVAIGSSGWGDLESDAMKGIILAGGEGTRLFPVTRVVSKQLLPVYDKPLVYYPLSTLMQAGIRDILVISTPRQVSQFTMLLGDGSDWGIHLHYAEQPRAAGIPEAFLIGRDFLNGDSVCLALGDNIFHGAGIDGMLREAAQAPSGATILASRVVDPQRYGVIELDVGGQPISVEEKPIWPRSPLAVAGIYFFDHDVAEIAAGLVPSARGELEIADVIRAYLERGTLRVQTLAAGESWFDTGTHDSLHEAAAFIAAMQHRHGILIGSPEEVAYQNGWIDAEALQRLAEPLAASSYGQRLLALAAEALH